ncbi:MAG: histidine utilization repressor [Pseudomonadota bacterium]|nr:histidine utilization repressor [Pseudomonadota bacterium]
MEQQIAQEAAPPAVPIFQRIKDYLSSEIAAGRWKAGELVPSEQALVRQFGVSRMTVNRAVRELTAENVLTRRQGAGTFVAARKYQSTLVEVRNIADDIRARGRVHHSSVHLLEGCTPSAALAAEFDLEGGATLFHSLIVHYEDDIALQVEDRWVNPACAPHYLTQDFLTITPNEYLVANAPLTGATYSIEALPAPPEIGAMLAIAEGAACLVLRRRTVSQCGVASVVTMWHPGTLSQFTGTVV